jgi:hypothetical protein
MDDGKDKKDAAPDFGPDVLPADFDETQNAAAHKLCAINILGKNEVNAIVGRAVAVDNWVQRVLKPSQ